MIAFLGMLTVNAQNNSLKVVVTADGDLVGRYVRQTSTTYIANPLDWEVEVSKKDHRVEIWTSTRYAVVCQITEEDSNKDYPENSFQCLGKVKGWYKISIKGKVGYIRQDLVEWAAYYAD